MLPPLELEKPLAILSLTPWSQQNLMYVDYLETELGLVEIKGSEKGVTSIYFISTPASQARSHFHTENCKEQLREYFSGTRREFEVDLDIRGTTFQTKVWQQLLTIPYGVTASYAQIAHRIGNTNGVRAVGMANSKNPISIIVPCHRVIGSSGKLVGYAGGLDKKEWLLKLEKSF